MLRAFIISEIVFSASIIAGARILPVKVENYLKRNYPGWQIGESWQVDAKPRKGFGKGDFNGDGKTDYAVLITKDDRIYALALIAAKNNFRAYNLLAQKRENRWIAGIDITPGGSLVDFDDQVVSTKSFVIKNDGIELYDGERHGFYWQNGKFLSTAGS